MSNPEQKGFKTAWWHCRIFLKIWNCPLLNTLLEVALILKHNPLFKFVYLQCNCSNSWELELDVGDLVKIKDEEVDSSVSVDISWLPWKHRLRGLFLELAPCFFLGVVKFWTLFKSGFFTDSWQDRHTTDCVINHIKQSRIRKLSQTSRCTLPTLN